MDGERAEVEQIDGDQSDTDEQQGERKSIFVRGLREPSKVEEHCLTRLPYRSRCRHCVRGRGREWPHRRVDEEPSMPELHADLCFLGEESEPGRASPCSS